jgi:hypothetical protein
MVGPISVKRLTAERQQDGGVLHATMVRTDYAGVACSGADMVHIAAPRTEQPELARR